MGRPIRDEPQEGGLAEALDPSTHLPAAVREAVTATGSRTVAAMHASSIYVTYICRLHPGLPRIGRAAVALFRDP